MLARYSNTASRGAEITVVTVTFLIGPSLLLALSRAPVVVAGRERPAPRYRALPGLRRRPASTRGPGARGGSEMLGRRPGLAFDRPGHSARPAARGWSS